MCSSQDNPGPPARVDELERELAALRDRLEDAEGGAREARRAQEALDQRYRLLRGAVSSGVVVYEGVDGGRDFLIKEFNDAAERIERVDAGGVVGRRLTEVFPGVGRFGLLEVLERVWRTGIAEEHPTALYTDHRITGWRRNRVFRVASGEVLVVYDDLTLQKRAEAAARESEERARAIADTALDSIFCKDRSRRYTFVNPAMTRLLGCTARDLLGRTPDEIFGPLEAAVVRDVDDRSFAGESVDEVRELEVAGETRYLHTIQLPMRVEEGEVVEICGIVRDITEARVAEGRIRRLNDELERRVAERTAELELANRELEAFSSAVSHDLRTPLRGIDAFAGILADELGDTLGDQGRKMVSRIRKGARRASQLVDGLLALSRASRAPLRRQQVDLAKVAGELVGELRDHHPDHPVDFVAPVRLVVDGDPVLLRTVLGNLLGNAWKFTRGVSAPRVELAGRSDGGRLVIAVTDNGVGFPSESSEKIFGDFCRAHDEDEFEGTGVGLATVQRIVERHGGRAWAEGETGGGAGFFFTLGP